jgi:ribosome biogenesis GTPase A
MSSFNLAAAAAAAARSAAAPAAAALGAALAPPAAPRSFATRYGASISWFPGHMARTTRALRALLGETDVVLEVRDARLPFSSANPALAAMAASARVPRVLVLNKADLAAPALEPRVRAALRAEARAAGAEPPPVVFSRADGGARGAGAAALLAAVDALPRARARHAAGAVLALVGAPNVGKSSLVNALRGAARWAGGGAPAAVAPTPGSTRALRALRVRAPPAGPPLWVWDSPGVLAPRLRGVEHGVKLTVAGCIRDAAVPPAVQAEFLLYAFATTGAAGWAAAAGCSAPWGEDDVGRALEEVAARLGARRHGGALDTDAAAAHLVRAFQAGKLGRHTLDFVPREEEAEEFFGAAAAHAREAEAAESEGEGEDDEGSDAAAGSRGVPIAAAAPPRSAAAAPPPPRSAPPAATPPSLAKRRGLF